MADRVVANSTTATKRGLWTVADANAWRAMVLRSGIALAAGFVVLMVLARFPIPPLAVYVRKPTAGGAPLVVR